LAKSHNFRSLGDKKDQKNYLFSNFDLVKGGALAPLAPPLAPLGLCPSPTLDFYTWYKYSRERLKSAIFRCFFCYFLVFFPLPPLLWKRLNSAIFRIFLLFFGLFSFVLSPPPPAPPPLRKFFCRRLPQIRKIL